MRLEQPIDRAWPVAADDHEPREDRQHTLRAHRGVRGVVPEQRAPHGLAEGLRHRAEHHAAVLRDVFVAEGDLPAPALGVRGLGLGRHGRRGHAEV